MALEVPLAVNLQRRATAELETQALVKAQTIATAVGAENLQPDRRKYLKEIVKKYAVQVEGRVIVVDKAGILLADSSGSAFLGALYATSLRPEIGNALDGTPQSVIRHSVELGQDLMATAVPIRDEGELYGAVRITQSLAQVSANLSRIILGLVAIGVAGLAAGLLIAFALAGSFSQPLSRLAQTAHRLGRGDLTARAGKTEGAKEIVELAGSFDEMASRLESTVRAQREFVANASHQLRTPLTGMKLRLETAIAETPTEDVRHQLEAAEKEVDRLAEIVDRLLVMARRIEMGGPSEVDLGDAVGRAIERWEERAARHGATIEVKGEGGSAQGDRADLDQILDNLLDNAIAYAPGPVAIETGRADGRLFVAVEDRGPGIPAADAGRVTERFFRGRAAPPGGSGLGLAIVRELAERWGGTVVVGSSEAGGTRVEVRLMPADAAPPEPS